ncbi:hypothetical protein ACFPU1_00950 [Thalassorhabdus alkalitolerans]|uniref:Uncharacterized protein n=1 Tax=Thalassorhabdus alkalitolerans TaxID=2282697 RepID=A0ABW0YFX4_9BACI|nr:hypothetical protein [Bacillus sp. FJAT-44742]
MQSPGEMKEMLICLTGIPGEVVQHMSEDEVKRMYKERFVTKDSMKTGS